MTHQEYIRSMSLLECSKISEESSLRVIKQNDEVSSSKQLIFNSETFQSIFGFVCVKGRVEYCIHFSRIMLCKADVKLL